MSVYQSLLDQIVSALSSVTFSHDPQILRRKKLSILEQDPKYLILVSPDSESYTDDGFEQSAVIQYPIAVAISTGSGNLIGGDTEDAMLSYRELVRNTLNNPNIASFPTSCIVGVTINLRPAFDKQAYRDNRDVSYMQADYLIQEPRPY